MPPTRDVLGSGRALLKNGVTIGSVRIVTAALGLLTVPVIVAKLGITGFGVWESMIALGTFATTFQGTVTGTLMWRMAHEYGAGRKHEIPRIVQLGVASSLTLFLLLAPLAWLFGSIVVRTLHIPAAFAEPVRHIFPVLIGILALTGTADALDAAINANQRAGTTSMIAAAGLAAHYLVTIGALVMGLGFWALVAGQASSLSVRVVVGSIVTTRLNGRVSLLPTVPRSIDKASLRYGALLAVGLVSAVLRDQTDRLVLAFFGSALLVGYYGIALRLASLVTEVSRLFYIPLQNAAGALSGLGDWAAIQGLYNMAMQLLPLATGSLLIVIGGLSNQLITLWLGTPTPSVTPFLLILLLGNVTAVTLTGPGSAICRGIGRVEIETGYVLVNLVANVILTVLLVSTIGAFGTVVASSAAWAASSLVFLFILHRKLDLPLVRSRNAVLALALTAGIAMTLSHFTPSGFGTQSRGRAVMALIGLGTPAVLVYLSLAFGLRLIPSSALRVPVRLARDRVSSLVAKRRGIQENGLQ
jgi:O-antigen/teichoic acid export membrane protein